MPLSINVGLSRKASRDYQSTGTSINIVAELDAALLARPDELHRQIDGLYRQARDAIDRNAAEPEPAREARRATDDRRYGGRNGGYAPRSANGSGNGNGHARRNGNGNGHGGGTMTDSQRRAILAIARRANADIEYECREIIGAAFDDLTLRQASELIDHLKSIEPANGRGVPPGHGDRGGRRPKPQLATLPSCDAHPTILAAGKNLPTHMSHSRRPPLLFMA